MKKTTKGFTLIELLVVIIIISILITLVITGFSVVVRKTRETTTKSNLYALQRAIRHYNLQEGEYPQTLDDLIAKKYIEKIPTVYLHHHRETSYYILGSTPTDSGKWLYDPSKGIIRVDCTHQDSDGNVISTWKY